MKVNYYDFKGFENIFLEDSFVLNLIITPLIFTIDLELILTQNHFLYQKPLPNELYCYRKAQIKFSNVESIIWTDKIQQPLTDASGEMDFGNIDEFLLIDGTYKIFGELGNLEIIGNPPELEMY